MHCSTCRPPSVVAALLIYTPKQREHNPGAVPAVGNAKEEENAKMQQNRREEEKEYRQMKRMQYFVFLDGLIDIQLDGLPIDL